MHLDFSELIEEKGAVGKLQMISRNKADLDDILSRCESGFNLAKLIPAPLGLEEVSPFGLALFLGLSRRWEHAAEVLEAIGEDDELIASLRDESKQIEALSFLQELPDAALEVIVIRKNVAKYNAISRSDWIYKNHGAFVRQFELEFESRESDTHASIYWTQPVLAHKWIEMLSRQFPTIHFILSIANKSDQSISSAYAEKSLYKQDLEARATSTSCWLTTTPSWLRT